MPNSKNNPPKKGASKKAAAKKGAAKKGAASKKATSKSAKGKAVIDKDLKRGHLRNEAIAEQLQETPNNEGNASSSEPQMYGGNQAQPREHTQL